MNTEKMESILNECSEMLKGLYKITYPHYTGIVNVAIRKGSSEIKKALNYQILNTLDDSDVKEKIIAILSIQIIKEIEAVLRRDSELTSTHIVNIDSDEDQEGRLHRDPKEVEFLDEMNELANKYEIPFIIGFGNGSVFTYKPKNSEKAIKRIKIKLKKLVSFKL